MKKQSLNRKRQSLFQRLSIESLETRHLLAGPYAPAAGEIGSTAISLDDSAIVAWATSVADYTPGTNVDPEFQVPERALGPAEGTSVDAVSLGRGGEITLGFDAPIRDGLGADFAVFENSFSDTFLELGFVEVSSDGVNFFRFQSNSLTPSAVDSFGSIDPTEVNNLAGKFRQGFGVPFDLEELDGVSSLLDVSAVTHIRLVDVVGDGSALDGDGDPIFDPFPTFGSAGLDVDAVGVIHQAERSVDVVGFEDVGATLAAQSAFFGPDPNGTAGTGEFGDQVVIGSFTSETLSFNNTFSLDFGSWQGWAYSNETDTTTPGFENQFSSFAGGGASGSSTFGLAFPESVITRDADDTRLFESLALTNTTFTALSILNGDSFARQFGGESGDDPDFFLLTIEGRDSAGASIGTVDFFLADYRFDDNSRDFVVDDWQEVDLSSIGTARSLEFSFTSSDVGPFGINTPTYVAVDDLRFSSPVLPIDIADNQVSEADGDDATTVRISRANDDLTSPINITIAPVDSDVAVLPTNVVIPANSRFVEFPVDVVNNDLVDGDRSIVIEASAEGFVASNQSLTIQDDDVLTLTAAIDPVSVVEGGFVSVEVTRNAADTSTALALQVSTPDTSSLSFTTPIEIPAGQSSVTFLVEAVDDDVAGPDRSVSLSIDAAQYVGDSLAFQVTDDDQPTVLVSADFTSVSESLAPPTIGFEDFGASLAAESFNNGSDGSGGFSTNSLTFNNNFNPEFGSWSGWSISNTTDTTTPGFTNQYSAFTGVGANQSDTYGVAGVFAPTQITRDPSAGEFASIEITNTTFAALSILQGDAFARQFGGDSGDDPDFFLLTIDGIDAAGDSISVVEFFLADYRFEDNSLDFIVDEWTTVDLSSIAEAITLDFSLTSSDVGAFGINTPAYFAADNVTLTSPVAPQNITVSRNSEDLSAPLQVSLSSNDTTEIVVPNVVEIPAEQTSVQVPIEVVRDFLVDGDASVLITAESAGHVGSTLELTVTDEDSAELTLTVQTPSILESSGEGTLVVHRNVADTSVELNVELAALDADQLNLPASVTIPVGARSVEVEFSAIDNVEVDADRDVSIEATAVGFATGVDVVSVVNDDVAPPELTLDLDRVVITEDDAPRTVSFEEFGVSLTEEGFYNGSDLAGGFSIDGVDFNNSFNSTFGSWTGWSVSNVTDNTTPGFENQYSAITGSGALGSSTYAVGNAFSPDSPATLIDTTGDGFDSLFVTNATFAALSIRDGDAFARQFGGETGDDPDFFALHIEGVDLAGDSVGVIDFFLADFRFDDNSLDFIVDDWQQVDVSGLVDAVELRFTVSSSDVGAFGINTPAYFAIDHVLLNSDQSNPIEATVTRNDADLSEALEVQIAASDTSEVLVPESVVIPAGADSAVFQIDAVEDGIFDSDALVSVEVSASTHVSDTAQITVENTDLSQLSVNSFLDVYDESDLIIDFVVHRNTEDVSQELTVSLDSSAGISVPDQVTIPAGASAVSAVGTIIDNELVDGQRSESITAFAAGFSSGVQDIVLNDDEFAGLILEETDDSTIVVEPGGVDQVLVSLGGRPGSDVTVNVTIDGLDAAVSAGQLTFSPEQWNQPRAVDVTALPDWFIESDETVLLRFTVDADNSDPFFANIDEQTVAVTVQDHQSTTARLTEDDQSILVVDGSDVLQSAEHGDGLQLITNDLPQTIFVESLSSAIGLIQVDTAGGDDTVILEGTRFTSLDGGDGNDRLIVQLDAPAIDLVNFLDNRVSGFEELVIDGAGETQWTIDVANLPAIIGGDDALRVRVAQGQSVTFVGSVQSDSPVIVDGEFAQVVRSGETTVQVISETPRQNVANIYDVNQSGEISALDALLIINQLSDFAGTALPDVTSLEDFDGNFLDVTGDNELTALDALLVVNRLAVEAQLEAQLDGASGEQSDFLTNDQVAAFFAQGQSGLDVDETIDADLVGALPLQSFESNDQAIVELFDGDPDSVTQESLEAGESGDDALSENEIDLLSLTGL